MPQLDGVRAIAVIIVMISHAGLGQIIPGGFGVTIFFFLSGYLITSLLRSEAIGTGRIDFGAFYLRRVLRIMPPLYITLVLLTVGNVCGIFGTDPSPSAIAFDYIFLTNYAHLWVAGYGLPIPLWSLAVEEHFYLIFPLIFVFFLMKRSPISAAGVCGALCVLILLLRFCTLVQPDQIFHNYYWSHTRLDSILFGCCLALWQNPAMDEGAWRPKHWQAILAAAAILLTFAIRDEIFRQTIRYSIQGAALFVLFSYALSNRAVFITRILSSAPLAWVGLLSYTLYLCHFAIFAAMEANLHVGTIVAGVIGTPLAFAYAATMRALVEKPIIDWRHNRRKAAKAAVVAT